jgi:hypothetical protein
MSAWRGARSRSTAATGIPDNVRLWQGDSAGHWEGDTLVVETTNFNGKTWLNEVGDVISSRRARGRALHPRRCGHHHVTGDSHRPDRLHAAMDD